MHKEERSALCKHSDAEKRSHFWKYLMEVIGLYEGGLPASNPSRDEVIFLTPLNKSVVRAVNPTSYLTDLQAFAVASRRHDRIPMNFYD